MLIGITGSRGVLGTIISRQLQDAGIAISLFEGDITNRTDIATWFQQQAITHLIHLAAIVPVNIVSDNYKKAVEVNIQGSLNLLEVAKQLNQRPYFFYAGTCHIYRSSDKAIKEDDPIEPINLYGNTKYVAEVLAASFIELYPLPFCVGRIFSFYHDSQKVPFLYPSIKKRLATEDLTKPFVLRGAQSVRDLSNAEDLCKQIIQLVKKGSTGIYNIGSGKGSTIKDFVQSLSPVPLNIVFDAQEPIQYLIADTTKLKKELA